MSSTSRIILGTGVSLLISGLVLMYYVNVLPFTPAFLITLIGASICMFYFRQSARKVGRHSSKSWLALILLLNLLVTALLTSIVYENIGNDQFPMWIFIAFIVMLVAGSILQMYRYVRGELSH